jgi:C-terminal processing protease CtpA/Prc
MADAYATTEVQVERSQGEIRKLLHAHGASNFSFAEGSHEGSIWAAVEFVHAGSRVRIQVPLKEPELAVINSKLSRTRSKNRAQIVDDLVEQEARRIWRVLFHGLKARLVSVEERVETFEQAFLAHLVDPVTGRTLWEAMQSAIDAGDMKVGGVGMTVGPPQLGPAPLRVVDSDTDAAFRDEGISDGDVVDAEVVPAR